MRDEEYGEGQRQSVEGRWTLWRVRERDGAQRFGRWWHVDPTPVPEDTPDFVAEKMPVVPCDDATIERVWPQIAKAHEFSGDYAFEVVCDVLRLAGEGGSPRA